jgi:DivIVA domain-containing protein
VVSGESLEPDQEDGEPTQGSSEQGESSIEPSVLAAEIRDVSFPASVRGYDRRAVDDYLARVNRLIAELEGTRSPETAVKRALEQVAEQTSGLLQRAGETVEEITVGARREADETTARAQGEAEEIVAKARTEADETLARSNAEAETTVTQARQDAADHRQRTEQEIAALQEEAEARMRELRTDTEAIRQERRQLLTDLREIAGRVEEVASGADARFPGREPTESTLEATPERKSEAGPEQTIAS